MAAGQIHNYKQYATFGITVAGNATQNAYAMMSQGGSNSSSKSDIRKLEDKEVEQKFGKDFHKPGKMKDIYKDDFRKQLRKNGDKNFDFYLDRNTNEILLKGNSSGKEIRTGDFFNK